MLAAFFSAQYSPQAVVALAGGPLLERGPLLAVVHERDRVAAGRLHPFDGELDDGAGADDRLEPVDELLVARRSERVRLPWP